ncbi:hypothetical protein D9V86_04625 [Bacteroidetes/Chlorobi group bacterium ChocPot_Mid]|nr:MAG: hypothetical protein D9V86_04625 [Bacteroidetes/Chlorobi group bacterium ChocPot_Mid]
MKVLITVKAYPAISTKYGETVCTAGITEDGKWIRIYPIPFRKLDYNKQFKKYDWVEIDLIRNAKDFRPESYRPKSFNDIKTIGHIESDGNIWYKRRKVVLKKVYTNLNDLILEAKDKKICTSLATFKPAEIINFIWEPVSNEWNPRTLKMIESKNAQANLFETIDEDDIENFEVVNKVPYKFSFIFMDMKGKQSKMMIEDWETGMLYWNSLIRQNGDEQKACEDVKKKYFDDFAKTKDYYFFLGTTKRYHFEAPNPFVIIGDFRPKPIFDEGMF